jgi:uncharacterized damage-inducible protein DinB
MTFSEQLLPEFEAEMENTRKLLALVPDGKLDYKPHEKSMPLGRLAGHVGELPGWFSSTLDVEELSMPADFQPWIPQSRAEILEHFDKGVADARSKISQARDEDWGKTWTFKWGGQTVLSMPRRVVARSLVMNHLIHHRAQLGVYLRLNNIEIPGMYGPSADEMKFWEPAKA